MATTCSPAFFCLRHSFFFLLSSAIYWYTAQTENISPKCTRSSLSKTSVIKIYEGIRFNFSIEAFKYDCETSPCTEALECSLGCGRCAHYPGVPPLSFNLVNKLTGSSLPNVTCRVGSPSTGAFPVFCSVKNSMASNSTLYRMDILSIENPAVPDRLGETPATMVVLPGSASLNHSIGSWINGMNVFKATSKVKFYVHLKDAFNNWIYGVSIQNQPLIGKVTEVTDTSNIIYEAPLVANVKAGYQLFEHRTTTPGVYLLHIMDPGGTTLLNSPFSFNITAGDIFIPNCLPDWTEGNVSLKAGEVASLQILMKDVYNNTFSTENGRSDFFQFSVISNSSELANLSVSSESGSGHEIIQFISYTAGRLFLEVGNVDDTQITGSPFMFYVAPAALSISSSTAEWVNGNSFLAGASVSFRIILRDKYSNMLNSTLKNQKTTGFSMIRYSVGAVQRMIPTNFSVTSCLGYELVQFVPYMVGNFKIWIGKDNIPISNSILKFAVVSATVSIAQCRASWPNGVNKFRAGNSAAINISLHDAYGNAIQKNINTSSLQFSVRVNGRKGESVYISNVAVIMNRGNISITFMPCLAGVFSLQVENNGEEIQNSPLTFTVFPGNISIHASLGSWQGGINSSKPGDSLKLNIFLRDAFGNSVISATKKTVSDLFIPKLVDNEGQYTENLTFNINFTNVPGNLVLSFSPKKTGKQWLQVGRHGNQSEFLFNSPLSFFVEDGPLSLEHTYAEWKYGINIFPPEKGVKLFVFQRDKWGNSVNALANFQVIIYRGDETLPSPYGDIWFQVADGSGKGTQLITFTTTAAGIFSLYIEDVSGNKISGCPYNFSVLATYLVQENKSLIYGLGLKPSIVGQLSTFYVQLKDVDGQNVEGYSQTVSVIIDPESENEVKVTGTRVLDKLGLYKISIILNISGEHDMLLLYCNVPLNASRQIKKVVYAGNVSIADTVVAATDGLKYHPLILVPLPITILLKDNYGNPVPGQASLLSIKFTGHKRPPEFSPFQEMETGNYTVNYRAFDIAPMNITVYYRENITIPGFPFYCYTHSSAWFPLSTADISWTWEDTTAILNVLDNDYFRHKPGILQGVQKQPTNGVAFVKGQSLAYVPLKGFLGNDSFTYKAYDAYIDTSFPGYVHTIIGFVTVFVVKHPPEIISIPKALEVCQGQNINIKSGDKKFMIYYSKTSSPISYGHVFAKNGIVRTMENLGLSWKPSDSLSYLQLHHPHSESKDIDLDGVDDTINSALRSLIYIGAPNFHGLDKVIFSIKDEAGVGDEASVIVKVNQVNSPPYVTSYPYVLVDAQTGELLAGINYDGKEQYKKSLIVIMDDDIEDDVSRVEVLVKVEIGSLAMILPENSTENTEVMLEESYHWSPLPTATIENGFFSVEARSIKFRASLKDCNEALTKMRYNGTVDGVSFSITINDLGHYGMDNNCFSKNPYPLSVEKDLTLVFSLPRLSQSYWRKTILRTKVVVMFTGIVTFSFMGLIVYLLCSLTTNGKKSLQKIKAYLKEENEMDSSCVYNPMWIPSAPSSPKQEFSNTSNPHHVQSQKHALSEGLSNATEEMKTMLTAQIKKNLTSIKSISGLARKKKPKELHPLFLKDLQDT